MQFLFFSLRLCGSARETAFVRVLTHSLASATTAIKTLSLNPGGAAFGKVFDLLERSHRGIARERGEQGAVCPAETQSMLRSFACEQPINKTGRESVAAANAVMHVK